MLGGEVLSQFAGTGRALHEQPDLVEADLEQARPEAVLPGPQHRGERDQVIPEAAQASPAGGAGPAHSGQDVRRAASRDQANAGERPGVQDLLASATGQPPAVRQGQAGKGAAERLPHLLLFYVIILRQRPMPPLLQEPGGIHLIDLAQVHRNAELLLVPRAARLAIQRAEEDRRQASVMVQARQLLPDMARVRHGIHGDPGDSLRRCPVQGPAGPEHFPRREVHRANPQRARFRQFDHDDFPKARAARQTGPDDSPGRASQDDLISSQAACDQSSAHHPGGAAPNAPTAEYDRPLLDRTAHCAGAQIVRSGMDRRAARGARDRSDGPRTPWPIAVIPGYTRGMKTAISVPDEIFEQAAGQAAELGISRSEFFARAARRYLDELAAHSLTRQIDQALQAAGDDDSGAAAAAAGRRLLAAGDEDW